VADLDAEWRWRPSACSVTFDARNRDALTLPWPPASALVGAWRAEPPNAAEWRLCVVPNSVTMATPTYVAAPRPGLRFGASPSNTDVNGLVCGHDSAGLVVFTSVPLAEQPGASGVGATILLTWEHPVFGSWVEVVVFFRGYGEFEAAYSTESARDWLWSEPFAPDGDGGNLYSMGWMVKDRYVQMWVRCGAVGSRSTLTRHVTFTRHPEDNAPEPDILYLAEYRNLTVHEFRLVSPAPSPTAWETVIHEADTAWSAL
jgi:hypothetical protein